MHPYRMQRLIKDRGKDQVINVEQRASLYQTIGQLLRAGLITSWENTRQEGFPERTIYKLTDEGHQTALTWLREMLATPAREFPEFPAAISLLPLLTPEDGISQLEIRVDRLTEQKKRIDQELQSNAAGISRLFLLESDYMKIMLDSELKWVRSIIKDLRNGRLAWNQDWMHPALSAETEGKL
jgi:DNA-binding PadR family transcriptional regulator